MIKMFYAMSSKVIKTLCNDCYYVCTHA